MVFSISPLTTTLTHGTILMGEGLIWRLVSEEGTQFLPSIAIRDIDNQKLIIWLVLKEFTDALVIRIICVLPGIVLSIETPVNLYHSQ